MNTNRQWRQDTEKWTDKLTDRRWTGRQTDGWADRRMDGWTNTHTDSIQPERQIFDIQDRVNTYDRQHLFQQTVFTQTLTHQRIITLQQSDQNVHELTRTRGSHPCNAVSLLYMNITWRKTLTIQQCYLWYRTDCPGGPISSTVNSRSCGSRPTASCVTWQ